MTSQRILNTFANDYKDDYRDSDGFHRVLFNPSRAVQPRELTTMQTIMQAEMKRFGDNIFKDGGAVNPSSNVYVNKRHAFVKLASGTDVSTVVLQTTFTGATSGVTAKLLEVVAAEHGDPPTLYVQYTGGGGTNAATRFAASETIDNGTLTFTVQATNTSENPAIGYGTQVSVGSGDFYTQGFFTSTQPQSLILDKYSEFGTATIGFRVDESIVSATDDDRLYDNQGDVPNLTAPGADRYKIDLTLINDSDIAATESFVYIAKVDNGQIVQVNNGREDYNRILDLVAERTKEESGNYVLDPFLINYQVDSDENYLIANVSTGVGYVNGYRRDPLAQKIRVAKPQTTELLNNDTIPADYGNFVEVDTMLGLPDITSYETVNLMDDSDYASGNIIGTARVRGIEDYNTSTYKMYLFDMSMHTGKNFRSTKCLGTSATENSKIVLENSVAVLKEQQNNDLLFPFPTTRPSSISAVDYTYTVMRHATKTVSTNTITLTKGTGESFTTTSEWIFADTGASGALITPTNVNTTTGLVTFSAATGPVDAIYLIQKGGSGAPTPYKTKTLTNATATATVTTDSDGSYVDLGKVDIIDVERVRAVDSDGADLTSSFYLDNGQRDNYYDHGRMVVAPGVVNPSGNIFIRFNHFAHSGVGDFFCVNSYDTVSDITYATIPTFRQNNGVSVPLRDVLDFRPTIDDTGTQFTGTGGFTTEIPQNTDLITLDTTYYLPRKDRLELNIDGAMNYITGEGAFNPVQPSSTQDAMVLYNMELNANTLNEQDLTTYYVDNRRYTMRDIGKLHREINKVKEMTTLSLLDMEASTLEVLDDAGLNRTKAGFLTDDFIDHRASNVDDLEYRASIDPTKGIMRPASREKNITLTFDSDNGDVSNTVLKADSVMLNHTETLLFSQSEASRTENVNPFTIMYYKGLLVLSPSSDESRSTTTFSLRTNGRSEIGIDEFLERVLGTTDTNNVMDTIRTDPAFGGRSEFIRSRISIAQANNFTSAGSLTAALETLRPAQSQILASVFDTISPTWREFIWGWAGVEKNSDDAEGGTMSGGVNMDDGSTFGRFATRLFVPRIRAREIRFRAVGLLPNARHWPFFDGENVTEHCLQNSRVGVGDFVNGGEDSRWRWGSRRNNWTWPDTTGRLVDAGRENNWHPFWGASTPTSIQSALVSDSVGTINGSFFIPDNDNSFFYTGSKLFELIDVSSGIHSDGVSYAQAEYEANGIIDVRFRRIPPPPPPPPQPAVEAPRTWETDPGDDPIAQSFFVSNPSGAFITKIGAYFKGKDDTIPIQCFLSPMVEGYPAANRYYRDAASLVHAADVNTSEDATSVTYFEFDNPVFLPAGEHCLILKSPSFNYTVYVSRVGDFVLGTTEQKITKQPTLNSFFKSQNGSTWSAAQWTDLKVDMYRAVFETTGDAVFTNDLLEPKYLSPNPLLFDSGDATVRVIHPNHGLQVNDYAYMHGLDSSSSYPMNVNSVNGDRLITAIDGTGYTFEADSAATSDMRTGGRNIFARDNILIDTVYPSFETQNPQGTAITYTGKFTTGKSFAGSETPYSFDPSYSHTLRPFKGYDFDAPRVIVNDEHEGTGSYPTRSAQIKATLTTESNWVSPVIDVSRTSLTCMNNLIDRQDSAASTGYNVPLSKIDETDPIGGTHLAKHVSKPVTLEEDAVGIKILVGVNQPAASEFEMYYKTLTAEQNLNTEPWTLIAPEESVRTDEDKNVFREHRYLIGGFTGLDDPFSTFQVKIVMRSTNSSKVPVFKDLRVVALTV